MNDSLEIKERFEKGIPITVEELYSVVPVNRIKVFVDQTDFGAEDGSSITTFKGDVALKGRYTPKVYELSLYPCDEKINPCIDSAAAAVGAMVESNKTVFTVRLIQPINL